MNTEDNVIEFLNKKIRFLYEIESVIMNKYDRSLPVTDRFNIFIISQKREIQDHIESIRKTRSDYEFLDDLKNVTFSVEVFASRRFCPDFKVNDIKEFYVLKAMLKDYLQAINHNEVMNDVSEIVPRLLWDFTVKEVKTKINGKDAWIVFRCKKN